MVLRRPRPVTPVSAGASRRVLVADGAPPAALAVARSLVRAGHLVEATRSSPSDRAPRSRGVTAVEAPAPTADPTGFAAALRAAAAKGERPVVVPATDGALLALLPRREELEEVADLPLPPTDVVRAVLDKDATLAAARRAGVAVPETFLARSAADAERCGVGFPAVVKPVSSRWATPAGPVRAGGPAYARDVAGLRAALAALEAAGAPGALVQRYVPGTGRGVGLLLRGGGIAAVFVHRRLREVHPAGGPSAAAVSEPPDPALVEPAAALLRALRWEGLAMVEFRREGAGVPVLMEVNGRSWGTLGLAVDAGVDFPRLLVEGFAGPPPEYRAGVRRRWFAGDLRRVVHAARGAPEGFPGPFPGVGGALGSLAADCLRATPDFVFRWGDPGPWFGEMAGGLR